MTAGAAAGAGTAHDGDRGRGARHGFTGRIAEGDRVEIDAGVEAVAGRRRQRRSVRRRDDRPHQRAIAARLDPRVGELLRAADDGAAEPRHTTESTTGIIVSPGTISTSPDSRRLR